MTSNFVPEIGSAPHIYFDLSKAFIANGHEVDVVTSYPRKYNLDKTGTDKEIPMEEIIDGISVHRSLHLTMRDIIALRGLEHFIIPQLYFRTYKKLNKRFDVCLIFMPPLPLYFFARRLKKRDGTPSVLNYQDFHPQELTDVGVLKNKLMIKLMEYIERRSYNNSDHITVITSAGIGYVKQRGCRHDRIDHIYNGFSTTGYENVPADFKEKNGLQGKFIVTYAGILSPFQGLDVILDAAKLVKDQGDVQFLIVGDGMIKTHLEERKEAEALSNVTLMPFQPRDDYKRLVKSSDICLVSLDDRMKAPCLPGKIVSILAAERPIIAAVPADSETARVIATENIGVVVDQDPKMLAEAVLKLKSNEDLRKILTAKGREFLEANMDIDKNAKRYEQVFKEAVEREMILQNKSTPSFKRLLFPWLEDRQ